MTVLVSMNKKMWYKIDIKPFTIELNVPWKYIKLDKSEVDDEE